ncbi:HD domain-containing protein [Sphingomonas lenta]|uniref:Phosphohydrolase n=1 Tax=Sphingomonas lenta TaxID=1141887 RepID=A0A2A2SE03_9SPHN|nr:hypothetical protein [Sphingomonas lenta]PAX07486.1 hypothetical protein CKY28_07420 [Sphingomonas lenta]
MESVPPALLDELRERHGEPGRHYHSWAHIEALLRWFDEVEPRLADADAVRWAILFHDAVYDPTRGGNEERSAALLEEKAAGLLDPTTLARAARLVRATAGHAIPDGLPAHEANDMALFLDMDLSILGAPAAVFDRYEADVRAEYSHVPEPAFGAGRRRILENFLSRPALFLSDWGRATFEAAARANLARSIARLSAP